MRRSAVIAGLALMAAGCDAGSPVPDAQSSGGATSPTGPTIRRAPQAVASAAPATGRKVAVENDLYEFTYSYPGKAAAIPALKALLDKRLESDRAELEKGSKEDQLDARQNDYPYRTHSSGANWQVVTDLPRWLSLSAEMDEYGGGAHGMTFYDALLWDREQNLARQPSDLFVSKAALGSALREPFCAALDKERVKRRGAPVDRNSGDQFDECIDPTEHTMILGSSNGRTFDRIGVLVEPYAAGPYAEGVCDVTLPVTPQVLGAVKPAYRSEFAIKR
jgi:hypothetical protein